MKESKAGARVTLAGLQAMLGRPSGDKRSVATLEPTPYRHVWLEKGRFLLQHGQNGAARRVLEGALRRASGPGFPWII